MNMNSSTSWTAATLAAAKTAGNFFQFAVAPASGNQCSLSSIAFVTYQQNPHATATVVLEYSTNGFATAGVAVATNNPVSNDWNGATNTVSLSGISALQNITNTVTFRIWGYGFGAYEDKGLGQVPGNNPDVVVVGTVTFPAAPSVSISLQMSGSNLQLTWPQGTLLESSNVFRSLDDQLRHLALHRVADQCAEVLPPPRPVSFQIVALRRPPGGTGVCRLQRLVENGGRFSQADGMKPIQILPLLLAASLLAGCKKPGRLLRQRRPLTIFCPRRRSQNCGR